MSAPGTAAGGGSMPVFTSPKTLRKNRHRANRSGRQTPRRSTPSLARLVTRFAPCRCPITTARAYRTLPLAGPRLGPPGFPLPVLGIPFAALRSPLHNETLCKLPRRQNPPVTQTLRVRATDRPGHRQPAPRSWVPWSRFRGCRRSTWPPSRTALRAVRRFAGNARLRALTGRSGRTLVVGCLVLSSWLCGIRGFPRCIPAHTPPPLRLRLRSGGSP